MVHYRQLWTTPSSSTAGSLSSDDVFCTAGVDVVGEGIDESQLRALGEADLSPTIRTEEYAAELKRAVDSFIDTPDLYFIDTMGLATLLNEICGTEMWGVEAHSD